MTDPVFLVCYRDQDEPHLGVQMGNTIYALTERIPSLEWLLTAVSAGEVMPHIMEARSRPVHDPVLLPLRRALSRQEVWAAGVTYKKSEEARERESNQSTVYSRVYEAKRPELFMKAMAAETMGQGEPVGIRYDAVWSVPEPELTVVLNSQMEVVGFTLGNDMSSRDIEGENPLYLPQAKVYDKSCSLGPRLWLMPEATAWPEVELGVRIRRNNEVVFEGTTSTNQLNRTLPELTSYLGRCKRFTHGALLLTGTGIVPPDDFTVLAGDEITVSGDPIGELTNTVEIVGFVN